ncbi:MAG: sugar phosphate isomerase/epimerase family protein [Planctomycetota bacterium]
MKLSIAGWSLNRAFRSGELKLADFPDLAKKEFGLDAVEFNSPFFASHEPAYLAELKARAQKAGVKVIGIAVDGMGDFTGDDPADRAAVLERMSAWFAIAKAVGSPAFRVNSGGSATAENAAVQMQRCIEGYGALAKRGEKEGITVLIENHGGLSADPDNIVKLVKAVNSKWFRTCPDFGNFPKEVRVEGYRKIAPFAFMCHAKTHEFDAQGNEIGVGVVPQCVAALKEVGFDGYLSIEYEGKGDQIQGVHDSIRLLKKLIA